MQGACSVDALRSYRYNRYTMNKTIELTVLTSFGCSSCKLFLAFWDTVKGDWPNVQFEEIDMLTEYGQALLIKHHAFASPAIIINDALFSAGGFQEEKFLTTLAELSLP